MYASFLRISSHPEAAQTHPFGAVPGLCALPANFLRNHPKLNFLQVHHSLIIIINQTAFLYYTKIESCVFSFPYHYGPPSGEAWTAFTNRFKSVLSRAGLFTVRAGKEGDRVEGV
jgi:hypothetical protein